MCNLILYAQWLYGIKRHSLRAGEIPEEVIKEAKTLFLISPGTYSIAIALSFFLPLVSILIYFITPVLYLIPTKLNKSLPQ